MMLIGEPDMVKRILGWDLPFSKINLDSSYINEIANNLKKVQNAEYKDIKSECRAIFITENRGYMIKITADDKAAYCTNYQHEKFWQNIPDANMPQ
jgi:hypothetical protein